MSYEFIYDSEIEGLRTPDKFYAYAIAYLNSSILLVKNITENEKEHSWENCSVVLHLSSHAVELFLNYALLSHSINTKVHGHDIEWLHEKYKKVYASADYEFLMPFQSEHFSKTRAEEIQSKQDVLEQLSTRSVRYRYTTNSVYEKWNVIEAFEPNWFLQTMVQMKSDFARIRSKIT